MKEGEGGGGKNCPNLCDFMHECPLFPWRITLRPFYFSWPNLLLWLRDIVLVLVVVTAFGPSSPLIFEKTYFYHFLFFLKFWRLGQTVVKYHGCWDNHYTSITKGTIESQWNHAASSNKLGWMTTTFTDAHAQIPKRYHQHIKAIIYAIPWIPVHTVSVGRCSYLNNSA